MKQLDFLDNLFFDPDIKITDMQKGLTNQNFLLEMNKETFVLRVPRADSEQIVDRRHETQALKAIANTSIDVETIYYDEISGYKVTRYLPDAMTYGECTFADKIERVARLMKKFHQLHRVVDEDFDPVQRLYSYKAKVTESLFDLDAYDDIIHAVEELIYEKILCHNDWVDGNILFTADQTYLIDYEYAANNDPLFDVMSFLSENQITDPTLRQRFYAVYFDDFTEEISQRLQLWEAFHNLLWCNWAMMMWESRGQQVYRDIAQDKYDALVKVAQTLNT